MSRITTWLTLEFDDSLEEVWFTDPLFDEEHANFELAVLKISVGPGKRVRHLQFELKRLLTPEQLQGLSKLKELGLFSDFDIVDEVIA